MTRAVRLAVLSGLTVFVVLAASLAACGGDGAPAAGQGRLEIDGVATIEREGAPTETVDGDVTVEFGDVVTIDEGTAVLTLAGGQEYELRDHGVGTSLEVAAAPRLLAGDVLVSSGFPAEVRYDTATLSAQGALKVLAGVPAAVAYIGRTRIDGAGALDQLPGLRQVVLTSAAAPEPLDYDGSDGWDRRYLGDAIAFGERLEALARGYTADLGPGGGRSVSFYEAVLPALDDEREFGADLLDADRAPGETLVGAAIAVQGSEGSFRERWQEVFSFRDAGAAWGIVALDQGVSTAPLLESIEFAVTAPTSAPTTTASTTTSEPSPTTAPTTTATTTPPDGGGPEPPEPESPPSTGLLDPVVDPLGQILDDLLGVLGLG